MRLRRSPEDRTHFSRAGKKRGGLPVDSANVSLDLLVGLVGVEQLEQLAIAELAERRSKNADDADVPGARSQHRRLCEEEIADQDRGAGGHHRIERRFPAPQGSPVDRVVMDQRRDVEQLDTGGCRHELVESLV